MSRSRSESLFEGSMDSVVETVERVEDDARVRAVLDALDDEDCRAILAVTGDNQVAAREVSERCDIPLSTTYRKLDLLVDAGLLEERTRLRRSGKHTSEYARVVESVVAAFDLDGETELLLSYRERSD